VHTEKFWQTSFVFFDDPDNLECINILIEVLRMQNAENAYQDLETMKAVACYDLGEFARFYRHGRQYLETKGAKE